MKFIFGVIACVYLLSPLLVGAVERGTFSAEPVGDFIVGPAKVDLSVAPGETKTQLIEVKSRIPGRQNFRVYARDFVGSDDELEVVRFIEDPTGINPYTLSDYLESEVSEFSLGLGESIKFGVKISVPIGADPGGRYGAIIVSAIPEETARTGAGVSVTTEIASLLLVRIDGDLNEYGYIQDFSVNNQKKGFFIKKPILFSTQFRNEGNVHLIPYGQIALYNMFGRQVDAIPIDAYFALPDSVRYREFLWPKEDNKLFLFGRYTAELQIYPGYLDVPEVVRLRFWYFPIWLIIAVFTFVFMVTFTVGYFKRNYQKIDKG